MRTTAKFASLKNALVSLSLVTSCLMAPLQSVKAEDQLIDRVVAVVDDRIILKSQLNAKMFEQAQQLEAQNIPLPDAGTLQRKVLDNMILEAVQLNRAKLLGLSVTDDEVNERMEQIAKRNNMNLLELRNRLNIEKPEGFKQLREEIKKQTLIQKLREAEIVSRVQITDGEISNYLKRQSLSDANQELDLFHILISLPQSPSPAERQKALNTIEDIRKRALDGEDFSQLAVRYSNGAMALSGGDLGWITKSEVPTFFADAVANLKVGQISEIVQSPSGFHLVKVAGMRDASKQLVEEFHLRRFVVLSDNAQAANPPAELVKLAKNLNSLEDFNALTDRFGDIPADVNQNSDLGWLPISEIPTNYRAQILDLQPNQALAPIAEQQGWVIIFLEDRRKVDQNLELKKKQASQAVRMRKANEMFDIWLRRLKDEAYIRIQVDPVTPSTAS